MEFFLNRINFSSFFPHLLSSTLVVLARVLLFTIVSYLIVMWWWFSFKNGILSWAKPSCSSFLLLCNDQMWQPVIFLVHAVSLQRLYFPGLCSSFSQVQSLGWAGLIDNNLFKYLLWVKLGEFNSADLKVLIMISYF